MKLAVLLCLLLIANLAPARAEDASCIGLVPLHENPAISRILHEIELAESDLQGLTGMPHMYTPDMLAELERLNHSLEGITDAALSLSDGADAISTSFELDISELRREIFALRHAADINENSTEEKLPIFSALKSVNEIVPMQIYLTSNGRGGNLQIQITEAAIAELLHQKTSDLVRNVMMLAFSNGRVGATGNRGIKIARMADGTIFSEAKASNTVARVYGCLEGNERMVFHFLGTHMPGQGHDPQRDRIRNLCGG